MRSLLRGFDAFGSATGGRQGPRYAPDGLWPSVRVEHRRDARPWRGRQRVAGLGRRRAHAGPARHVAHPVDPAHAGHGPNPGRGVRRRQPPVRSRARRLVLRGGGRGQFSCPAKPQSPSDGGQRRAAAERPHLPPVRGLHPDLVPRLLAPEPSLAQRGAGRRLAAAPRHLPTRHPLFGHRPEEDEHRLVALRRLHRALLRLHGSNLAADGVGGLHALGDAVVAPWDGADLALGALRLRPPGPRLVPLHQGPGRAHPPVLESMGSPVAVARDRLRDARGDLADDQRRALLRHHPRHVSGRVRPHGVGTIIKDREKGRQGGGGMP